ncbi:MAG: SPOR domain-containing protein [Paracoccaceae bacterium]
MADVDFDDFEGGYGTPEAGMQVSGRRDSGRHGWINIAGALTSVALIAGIAVWGYKIAVRDVMGIPVVRALEGPMRIAPENPGGEVTAHQGLSVNDIAAVGTAAPTADRLVLAPRPVDLSLEDTAGLAAEPPQVVAAEAVADPNAAPTPDVAAADLPIDLLTTVAAVPEQAPGTLNVSATVLALAEALAEGATPLTVMPPVEPVASLGDVEAPPAVSGGIGKSVRPLARPAAFAAAAPSVATAAAAPVTEVDPATLTVGTRLVQLGAYDDEETARKEWDKLASQFGELLIGKGRVVQSAQSGGRTFFRLRAAGFEGEDDARRFCSALLAENAACIPVAVR